MYELFLRKVDRGWRREWGFIGEEIELIIILIYKKGFAGVGWWYSGVLYISF